MRVHDSWLTQAESSRTNIVLVFYFYRSIPFLKYTLNGITGSNDKVPLGHNVETVPKSLGTEHHRLNRLGLIGAGWGGSGGRLGPFVCRLRCVGGLLTTGPGEGTSEC